MTGPIILASEFEKSFDQTRHILKSSKQEPKALIITTAAHGEGYEPDYTSNIKPFEDLGYKAETYDLFNQTERQVEQRLHDIDVIYVCGGNSFYLMEHMQNCSFKKLLLAKLDTNAMYMGSSAGSIVCSPRIDFIAPMDDPQKATKIPQKGLGLVDFLVLPHMDHAGLGPAANTIYQKHRGPEQLLAMNDQQALYIQGKCVKVIG